MLDHRMLGEQSIEQTWLASNRGISIEGDDVHVWRVTLDRPQSSVREFFYTLAPDERERAGRFYFQKDRDHFIVARAILRAILGRYLGLEAAEVRFEYSSYGKPFVTNKGCEDIRFNLSHSHGLALVAVTRGCELGIDVEGIRAEGIDFRLAEQFFSAAEVAALRSLPASRQVEAFFNCWTRKEAYIKARGEGLSMPLDRFEVSITPGEPAALLRTASDAGEVARWSMIDLPVGADFKAALVVERQSHEVRCLQWTD